MAPKVKNIDIEILEHIDIIYKMISKINVKINLDIKSVTKDLNYLTKRFNKSVGEEG